MKNRNRMLCVLAVVIAGLALAQQPAAKETSQGLYVVTYVDVYPNFAADAAKALDQFASDSKKDKGVVLFQVLRDVSRSNHFAIIELWQSRQVYDAHQNQAYCKKFRETIQPMLGSPFDERLYNGLP